MIADPAWIDTDDALAALVEAIRRAPRVALDTEFVRRTPERPPPALIQIAWTGGLALIDALSVALLPLGEALRAGPLTCGHALRQDLDILHGPLGGAPGRIFDTQIAAAHLGQVQIGLSNLLAATLGIILDKGPQRSDWTRRPLSVVQRSYAAADVAHLLALEGALRERLRARGRLAWAEEDCEWLRRGPTRLERCDVEIPEDLLMAIRVRADSLGIPAGLLVTRAELAAALAGDPPAHLREGWRRGALADLLFAS
jgi:ribonuclease D